MKCTVTLNPTYLFQKKMGKKEKMKEKMVSRIPLPSNLKVRYVRLDIHKRDFYVKNSICFVQCSCLMINNKVFPCIFHQLEMGQK